MKLSELDAEVERNLEYCDSIIGCRIKIQGFIRENGGGVGKTVRIAQPVNNTKLPRLVSNKFDGEVKKFNNFWPSFETTVHSNSSLSKVEKFTYLKLLLPGVAARAISGLILNNDIYDKAVEILK